LKVVDPLPRAVRELENLWIPLPDGDRMAARVWLPEDADSHPVPVIVEYHPYRKRDLSAINNQPMHSYLAGHGYAAVRLEIRGSGESDGILRDEYLAQELNDACDAIAWLTAQPWSTGRAGMIGNSWSGFNALQVAALRPPALGAIVTSCSTDDRYADDMHYMGGCLLTDMLDWGTLFQALLALPPDPALVGDRWRDMWQARIDALGTPPTETWLRHQVRDGFWRHGSVGEDFSRIEVPVLAVGGWLDGYRNAIPRLLSGLDVPRRGVIGPWAHAYPHLATPGPGYDFLAQVVRWFDHWLKGIDTGAMDEPMLRAWMAEDVPAAPFYPTAPGRWVGEDQWPSPRITTRLLHLDGTRLASEAASTSPPRAWSSPDTTGLVGGEWCPYGTGGKGPEFPGDQREDDGRSLTWDGPPLDERLEILGAPVVELELEVDRPSAFVAVRLCDVRPEGASTRVSFGVLNLTHRDGHAAAEAMVPGQRTTVRVRLNDTGYAFLPGHHVRLAVSTQYWPMVWPSPEPVRFTMHGGTLALPVRPPRHDDASLPDLGEPTWGPEAAITVLRPGHWGREIVTDAMTGTTTVTNTVEGPLNRQDRIGRALAVTGFDRNTLVAGDPAATTAQSRRAFEIVRDGSTIRVSADVALSCTRDAFVLEIDMTASEDDEPVWDRRWQTTIPREGV
jgi:putative CocE/NonD family hydrolase